METTINEITEEKAKAFQDAYLKVIEEHKMEHVAVLVHKLVQSEHGATPVYATEMRLRPYPLIDERAEDESTQEPEVESTEEGEQATE